MHCQLTIQQGSSWVSKMTDNKKFVDGWELSLYSLKHSSSTKSHVIPHPLFLKKKPVLEIFMHAIFRHIKHNRLVLGILFWKSVDTNIELSCNYIYRLVYTSTRLSPLDSGLSSFKNISLKLQPIILKQEYYQIFIWLQFVNIWGNW